MNLLILFFFFPLFLKKICCASITDCFHKIVSVYVLNKDNVTDVTSADIEITIVRASFGISDCDAVRFMDIRDNLNFISYTYDNCSLTTTNFYLDNQTYPVSSTFYTIRVYYECDSSPPASGSPYAYPNETISTHTDLQVTVNTSYIYYKCGTKFVDESGCCGSYGTCTTVDTCTCYTNYYRDGNGDCNLFNCSNYVYNDPKASSEYCLDRGNCTSPGKCTCRDGYSGDTCNEFKCFGVLYSSSSVCSGHGICRDSDNCGCTDNSTYSGDQCEVWSCFGVFTNVSDESKICSGSGVCTDKDLCTCKSSFIQGDECENNYGKYAFTVIIIVIGGAFTFSCVCGCVMCYYGLCCCLLIMLILKKTEMSKSSKDKVLKTHAKRKQEMEKKLLEQSKKEDDEIRKTKGGNCTIL